MRWPQSSQWLYLCFSRVLLGLLVSSIWLAVRSVSHMGQKDRNSNRTWNHTLGFTGESLWQTLYWEQENVFPKRLGNFLHYLLVLHVYHSVHFCFISSLKGNALWCSVLNAFKTEFLNQSLGGGEEGLLLKQSGPPVGQAEQEVC